MRLVLISLFSLFLFCSCADRNWNSGIIEPDQDQIQPYVFNRLNSFKFEVGSEESFSFSASYSVEFRSDTVVLEIDISDYFRGRGFLSLNGGEASAVILNEPLHANRIELINLTGNNIPNRVQLDFNDYEGQVVISMTPN
jgi:hypothetical protein